jgi:hypothetical protein
MNYSTLSLSELKALATANNVVPTGDKRSKKAWIDALELASQPTVAEDAWVAPEMPSEAEQEAISYAADSALAQTAEPAPVAPEPSPAVEQVLHRKSDKKGAATVFGSLLCIILLTIQAVLCIGCVIVQAAIHLKNLFGSYNPDYDLLGQLHDMVRQRKASPAQQAQQPAYQ